jgi:DNA-binding PadR family transcriptional regulator
MLKGLLEGVVLNIVNRGETYGYKITRRLQDMGFSDVVDGTTYTILTRLEKRGFLDTQRRLSENGLMRKYYTLNQSGKKELTAFWTRWEYISKLLNNAKKEQKNG